MECTHMFSSYASVILDVSINKTLDYGIPVDFADKIEPGVRVEVPVRGYPRQGYIFAVKETPDFPKVAPISRVISDITLVTQDLFKLALWMANYYCTPMRQVLKILLPSSVRQETKHKQQLYVMRAKTRDALREMCIQIRQRAPAQAEILEAMLKVKKGILLTELLELTSASRAAVDALVKKEALMVDIVRVDRSPLVNEEYFRTNPKKLNEEQAVALAKIHKTIAEDRYETHLIHGVTSSGKTEVYLQAIDQALSQKKGTIMLVPEISLTAQTIERFRSRFEGHIAILHHRLSTGERFDEWHKIRRGDAQIVIGARSAVFSPVENLGLIIVDEEHEQSYKQSEEAPYYHARDIAVMRGMMSKGAVILGSATPALESYHNAKIGKYTLSTLNARADSAAIPDVTIVDMKREYEKAKGYTNFSDALLTGIKKRQAEGEQTILFLNRRGFHTTLLCQTCGEPVKCQHCDVTLTFHKGVNHLACHLCGYSVSPPPSRCPSCQSEKTMKFRGVGTEQIQKALHAIFPDIRTIRMDADTTRHKGSHQKLLRDFGSGKADILIGTQMIAKGLHFPQVTLVGVLNSDPSLNIPDFRASETAFQLITQVSGRSGRGALSGEVIIQTCMPDNPTIQLAAKQDYEGFFEQEMAVREIFGYPPVKRIVKFAFSGKDQKKTFQFAGNIRQYLCGQLPKEFVLHPVIPSGYTKVKDRFRYQFLVRGPSTGPITKAYEEMQVKIALPSSIRLAVDVNPSSTFF